MLRYVLGFILAVVIITAGIVVIVVSYDEETPASRPVDTPEAASRSADSVPSTPRPAPTSAPAIPTPAPTVVPLPTLPPVPKATPYPAGDPELYAAIWRGTRDAASLQALVNEGREVNASNEQGDPFLYTAIWRASSGESTDTCGRRCGCKRARQR